jgi:hypothetical protein
VSKKKKVFDDLGGVQVEADDDFDLEEPTPVPAAAEQPAVDVPASEGTSDEDAMPPVEEPIPVPELEAPKPKRFRVSLGNHGPTSEHEAADAADAWDKYKAKHGIVKSDHQPEITEFPDA